MVAADDDRGLYCPGPNQLIEGQPRLFPFSLTQPANAGRQSLERDPLPCKPQPALQRTVSREQRTDRLIRHCDVGRISAECRPPEGTFPFTKQGSDISRNETWETECIFQTLFLRPCPQIVAIVERNGATALQLEHAFHMATHAAIGIIDILLRVIPAQHDRLVMAQLMRPVTDQRIMRGGLVRERIGYTVALDQTLQQVHGIAMYTYGKRLTLAARRYCSIDSLIDVAHFLIQVSRFNAFVDTPFFHFRDQRDAFIHRDRQRLRPAH